MLCVSVLFVLMKISNFLLNLGVHSMDSQGSMQEASLSKLAGASSGFPPTTSVEMPTQRQIMPPPSFFQGFPLCLIKCHIFSRIPSCHMFEVLDSRTPPMATRTPPSICRRGPMNVDHMNAWPLNPSLPRNARPRKKTWNSGIGWRQRGCEALEEYRALEGPLGHTAHHHKGGDA